MSNCFYPNLLGLGFSTHRIPRFNTSSADSVSGKQSRLAYWPNPKWSWELTYPDWLPKNDMITLCGFFLARQGSFDNFLFQDPYDNTVTNAPIGVGDGATTVLQLQRTMSGFSEAIQACNGFPVVIRNDWQNPINMVQWSEDATHWSLNAGLTVLPNAAVAPDGNTSADFVFKNNLFSSTGAFSASFTGDGVSQLTFTVYMMASANSSQAGIGIFDSTAQVWPTITGAILSGPGTFTPIGGTPASVTGLSQTQWTRVRVTLSAATTAAHVYSSFVYPDLQGSIVLGNGNFFWGSQLEFGTSASAYVKTAGLAGIGPISITNQPRTNLINFSPNPSGASWSVVNTVLVLNAATAPDGTVTATSIAKTNTTTGANLQQGFANADGVNKFTCTAWFLASATSTKVDLLIFQSVTGNLPVTATILNGPGSLSAGGTTNAIQLSGLSTTRWTRVQITTNSIPAASNGLFYFIYPDGFASIVTGAKVFMYAPQGEIGTVATSYIPTPTAADVTLTDWTLGSTGTLTMGETPKVGYTYTASFNYYFRVHFTDDSSDFENFMFQLWSNKKVTFESDLL